MSALQALPHPSFGKSLFLSLLPQGQTSVSSPLATWAPQCLWVPGPCVRQCTGCPPRFLALSLSLRLSLFADGQSASPARLSLSLSAGPKPKRRGRPPPRRMRVWSRQFGFKCHGRGDGASTVEWTTDDRTTRTTGTGGKHSRIANSEACVGPLPCHSGTRTARLCQKQSLVEQPPAFCTKTKTAHGQR